MVHSYAAKLGEEKWKDHAKKAAKGAEFVPLVNDATGMQQVHHHNASGSSHYVPYHQHV